MERQLLAPPPDAIRSFVAGPESPARLDVVFELVGDAVETRWTVPPLLEGWSGLAHGAAAAALHDEAAINAIVFLGGECGFTRRLDVRYLRPIRIGHEVHVRARTAKLGDKGGTVTSEIRLADGAVASTAETEYAFVDRALVERVLGQPVSDTLASWFAAERKERIALALAWARTVRGA